MGITKSEGKKERRMRLSIDLEAHPDVRDMLAAAIAATGGTSTSITITALREWLPGSVEKMAEQRAEQLTTSAAEFKKKFSKPASVAATQGSGISDKELSRRALGAMKNQLFRHRPMAKPMNSADQAAKPKV